MKKPNSNCTIIMALSSIILGLGLTGCGNENPQMVDNSVNGHYAADSNINLGMAYLGKNDLPRAKQRLLEALHDDPQDTAAWYSMAYFFECTSDYANAEKYYLRAIAINKRDGAALNNYGTFLCRHNRPKEGINQFKIALNSKIYLDAISAYENIGLCALNIPDYKTAEEYFDRALAEKKDLYESWGGLADIKYHQGNYKLALDYFNQYTKLSPVITKDMLLLGIDLHRKLGNYAEAEQYHQQLHRYFPN